MTTEREKEVREEAERRIKLWVKNASFAEMTVNGSLLRFNMAIGGIGYPLEPENWMTSEETVRFITDKEFESPEYDEMVLELFKKYYDL